MLGVRAVRSLRNGNGPARRFAPLFERSTAEICLGAIRPRTDTKVATATPVPDFDDDDRGVVGRDSSVRRGGCLGEPIALSATRSRASLSRVPRRSPRGEAVPARRSGRSAVARPRRGERTVGVSEVRRERTRLGTKATRGGTVRRATRRTAPRTRRFAFDVGARALDPRDCPEARRSR